MNATDPHRQQDLYWRELGELTTAFCYYRLLRNRLTRWNQSIGIVKAVAASGTIAAWAIWQQAALLWAAIIAASQLIDAVKDVIPFQKNHRGASDLVNILDTIFIDAQFEWENIFTGRVPDDEILNRRHKLMRLRTEAEHKHFPDGHVPSARLFALARTEAKDYLSALYGVGESQA
jgi:hypothetical protein